MTVRLDNRRLAVLLGLSVVWLLLLCAPTFAHTVLVEASPAEGATLAQQPEQVRLRFNEPIEAAFDPIEVYGEQNDGVDKDNAQVNPDDPEVVSVGLGELVEGSYTVDWRVTSADGHPVDGRYAFAVGDSQADDAAAGADEDPPRQAAEQEGSGSGLGVGSGVILGLLFVAVLGVLRFVVLRRGA